MNQLPEGYKLELETFGHEVVWLVYNINNPDIYIRSTEINLNYATALFLSELEKEKQYVIDKAVLMQKNIAQYTPPSHKYTYYTDSIIRLQDKLDSINDSDDDLFSVAFNTIDNIYHMIVKSITQSN